ncbi:hypothetical protein IAQ67_28690 (plasmid) [Paenibacillus peoriae]|uniref:Uncharacterized protein n=1 Tax=Paenibacillus peoriae TaxID=59893 RepID=A0A7H0YHD2_9BACL|nr:hypothetical protein [Paenibacillus peoriae]QNR70490.1 hypothetical protein IAQ67_28690 [Paenibacillus peoriae]
MFNQDYYMDDTNVAERLYREWKEHGNLIIAYDYDNTVFDYHGEGHSYNQIVKLLRECKELGAYLYVFTACEEEKFPQIEAYLQENNIPYDAINEAPDFLPFKGRKPYYNVLLDDRAGLRSAYHALRLAALKIKEERAFMQ